MTKRSKPLTTVINVTGAPLRTLLPASPLPDAFLSAFSFSLWDEFAPAFVSGSFNYADSTLTVRPIEAIDAQRRVRNILSVSPKTRQYKALFSSSLDWDKDRRLARAKPDYAYLSFPQKDAIRTVQEKATKQYGAAKSPFLVQGNHPFSLNNWLPALCFDPDSFVQFLIDEGTLTKDNVFDVMAQAMTEFRTQANDTITVLSHEAILSQGEERIREAATTKVVAQLSKEHKAAFDLVLSLYKSLKEGQKAQEKAAEAALAEMEAVRVLKALGYTLTPPKTSAKGSKKVKA